jgi:DNA polymerase I-like protein with 3'-5' exonuclease and polymerase domains
MPELKPLDIATLVPKLNPTLVVDGAGLEQLRQFFARVSATADPCVGLDYETNMTNDFWFRRARTLQIGNRDQQFVIDFLAFADGNEDKLFNSQGEHGKHSAIFAPVLDVLRPALEANGVIKVGVNLGFDYEVSKFSFGLRPWHLYSCDLAERVIVAGLVSLKLYSYFSLASLIARYFNWEIDKEAQTSFDLKTPLTEKQIIYCALDTRLPLAIRAKQLRILQRDGLEATVQIENDAIGAFVDMHLHGQRLDKDKWMARYHSNQAKLVATLKTLDTHFLPIVGSKVGAIDHAQLATLEATWRATGTVASAEEIAKTGAFKATKDPQEKLRLRAERDALTVQRKEQRAAASATYIAYRKRCNAARDLLEKCEGEALINYNSDKQVLDAMYAMRGQGYNARTLPGISLDTLAKHKGKPVADALVDYSDLKKKIGTYGAHWVTKWTTKPCKDEGWLHPMDERLHPRINQLEAETGRTSSTGPNQQNIEAVEEVRSCFIADPPDDDAPEGHAIVTVDQSGAELRIIAEKSQAESWIIAFNKDQDVHAVGTEIMYPAVWPMLTQPGCAYYEKHTEDRDVVVKGVTYHIRVGDPKKQKCECKGHKKKRDGNKAANFKLAYGGKSLADSLGCTEEESWEIMLAHEKANPDVWAYLEQSGKDARINLEARSMYGRRRLFHPPTWEGAAAFWRSENGTDECPNPTTKQVASVFKGMFSSIERRGKNHPIQATNIDLAKRSLGSGFDASGRAYLWHLLPQYKAKMLSFVHDEIIVQCPKRFAEQVAALIQDAFRRSGDEIFSRIEMKSDAHIADCWQK